MQDVTALIDEEEPEDHHLASYYTHPNAPKTKLYEFEKV
jgi:hypothetical protein